MGYLLKAKVPLRMYLCSNCLLRERHEHKDSNATANIRYAIPISKGNQQIAVSIDIKKITWKQIKPGIYEAFSEMQVECPLCSTYHGISYKVNAPRIMLESTIACEVCGSKLSLCNESIILEEESGREYLKIKGILFCKKCCKDIQFSYNEKADDTLDGDSVEFVIKNDLDIIRKKKPTQFKVGVTFTGTHRQEIVEPIVNSLLNCGFSKDDIFYDKWHDVLINGIDADIQLKKIYANQCACIVVFLSKDYNTRPWTRGVEWRTIRKLINTLEGNKICLLSIDNVNINEIDGLSSFTDIAKKITSMSADEVAKFIKKKYDLAIR